MADATSGPPKGGRAGLALGLGATIVVVGIVAALNRSPSPTETGLPRGPGNPPTAGANAPEPVGEPAKPVSKPNSATASNAPVTGEKPSAGGPQTSSGMPANSDLPPGHPPVPASPSEQVGIQWLGHSCFYIHSPGGMTVVTDPFDPAVARLPSPDIGAHFVLVSRDDPEHAFTRAVRAFAGETRTVVRGGDAGRGDLRITARAIAGEGHAWLYRIESGPLRIGHVAAASGPLTPQDVSWLGKLDVLLLPAGDPRLPVAAAVSIGKAVSPRLIIPMAYATAEMREAGSRLRALEPFVSAGPWAVTAKDSDVIMTSPSELPPGTELMTLRCRTH